MTITRGDAHCFLRSLRKKRLAALAPGGLHEDVQHVAVLVDGPPQVLPIAVDLQEDLVQVPFVAGSGLAAAQAVRVRVRTSRTSAGSSRK